MKKIGIITIHNAPNYGACLQCFALFEFLRLQGHEVSVIDLHRPYHLDYIPSSKFKPYKYRFETFKQKTKRIIKSSIYKLLAKEHNEKYIIPTDNNGIKIFEKLNNQISFTRPYYGIDELYSDPPEFDTYITGSDQVWNPTQAYCIEPYLLSFVKKGKKISYASSIGITELTKKEKKLFAKCLKSYDEISVREESAKSLLTDITGRNIVKVADPTFLLEKSYWHNLAKTPNETDYILVFTLEFEPEIIEYALKLSDQSGKKLISLTTKQPDDKRYTIIQNATPEEWLGYIKNADLVLTNSFHCTLFSILLGTNNFFSYISKWNIRGTRLENLLNIFEVSEHLIDNDFKYRYDQLMEMKLNHASIEERVTTERNKSIEFLLKAI